ncbi:hypothetical protein GCM10027048_06250 [Hymenobacter coalescens]
MLAFSLEAQAQYLSLESLIHLRGQDIETANSTLTAKGWRFNDAEPETEGHYSTAIWSYGQGAYSERARAFFRLMTADGYANKIAYQTSSKEHYALLKARIVANQMAKVASEAHSGYIITTYMGTHYYVTVSIGTDDLTHAPVYTFMLGRKSSYVPPSAAGAAEESDTAGDDTATEPAEENTALGDDAPTYTEQAVVTNALFSTMADNEESYAPRTQDVVLEDQVAQPCVLYARPWNSARHLQQVAEGAPVQVISKLLDEDHSYYFVYVDGRYGYLKFNRLRSNQGLP